jgi:hypothetical protein
VQPSNNYMQDFVNMPEPKQRNPNAQLEKAATLMKLLNDQPQDGGDLRLMITNELLKPPKLDSLKQIDIKRDIEFKLHVREDSMAVNMLERSQSLWNYPEVSVT